MPVASLLLGKNVALMTPKISLISSNCLVEQLSSKKWCILVAGLIGYVLVTSSITFGCLLTGNFYVMFSLLLSWFGTYLRWRLGALDAYLKSGFPLGTLLANSIGSFILAGVLVARAYVVMETGAGALVEDALSGVVTGFCGSLTTVSTFASQLVKVPFQLAAIYALVSLGVAQVVFTIILGTYSWIKY